MTRIEAFLQDGRHALRLAWLHPSFSGGVVLTLAVGIGASISIFGAVNAVLLRPLPYPGSERLVRIIENIPAEESNTGAPERWSSMDAGVFVEWRSRTRTLSSMAMYVEVLLTLDRLEGTTRLTGLQATPELWRMLRVSPIVGRAFTEADVQGGGHVVVLSHAAWQRHFGGAADVIGQAVRLGETTHTEIGVMPRDFAFPDSRTDLWTPLAVASEPGQVRRLSVLARLLDGVALEAANGEAAILAEALLGALPGPGSRPRVEVVSMKEDLVGPIRPALTVFVVAVTCVLLIACVNVANLFLARTEARRSEIAVRMTLGAERGRIVQLLLAESLVLATLGGIMGCLFAIGATRLMRALGNGLARTDLDRPVGFTYAIPRLDEVGVDASVLLYAVALTVGVGVMLGISPLQRLKRISASSSHRVYGTPHRVTAAGPAQWLIISQVAMTMVLLLVAGLLIRSFTRLADREMGFEPDGVLTFQTPRPEPPATLENALVIMRRQLENGARVVAELGSADGIEGAALATSIPMSQVGFLLMVGATADARPTTVPGARALLVSPDYFRVMGLRLTAGRGFTAQDERQSRGTFVINRTLARLQFGNADPLGQTLYLWKTVVGEVVGVVDDVRVASIDSAAEPQLYLTTFQTKSYLPVAPSGLYFAVRSEREPSQIVAQVRHVVQRVDSQATVDNVATMDQIVANSVRTPRSYAAVLGSSATVALLLAGIGLYSVMSYLVTRRTQEIGVRMALGAQRGEVIALVVRQALATTAVAVVVGLAGGMLLSRYLEKMLFGIAPLDPLTFLLVPVVFAAVVAVACFLPAKRATSIDPSVALRYQ